MALAQKLAIGLGSLQVLLASVLLMFSLGLEPDEPEDWVAVAVFGALALLPLPLMIIAARARRDTWRWTCAGILAAMASVTCTAFLYG